MLRPKKKITKRELKQDPVLTTYAKVLNYYEQNKKYLSYAVTALVVIVVATVVYTNNRRASNEKAAAELGKVMQYFDAASYQQAIDGVPEQGVQGLKAIVDNYGGESAEFARFYLANSYYMVGKYDEALQQFRDFSGGDNLLKSSALAGTASCYEAKSDYSSAAKYFEKAATKAGTEPVAAEYLAHAAFNYGRAGEKTTAVDLYKRLKKEFPTAASARDADRYIAYYSM